MITSQWEFSKHCECKVIKEIAAEIVTSESLVTSNSQYRYSANFWVSLQVVELQVQIYVKRSCLKVHRQKTSIQSHSVNLMICGTTFDQSNLRAEIGIHTEEAHCWVSGLNFYLVICHLNVKNNAPNKHFITWHYVCLQIFFCSNLVTLEIPRNGWAKYNAQLKCSQINKNCNCMSGPNVYAEFIASD